MSRQGQDRDSTVYVYVDITVFADVNIVGDLCNMAFIPIGSRPVSGDWVPAEITQGNVARILVGDWNNASGIQLANISSFPAKFDVWIDILDSPERPKQPVGTWTVT